MAMGSRVNIVASQGSASATTPSPRLVITPAENSSR